MSIGLPGSRRRNDASAIFGYRRDIKKLKEMPIIPE